MANEGFLGKTTLSGERAATDDHPAIIHALPLDASVTAAIPVGALMCRVAQDGGTSYAYRPYTEADAATAPPMAVCDKPCDPTGDTGETSAVCLVHGTVKAHLLVTGSAKAGAAALELLTQNGIFPV